MRTVLQAHEKGCWVACLAMLSGQSYRKLAKRFRRSRRVCGQGPPYVVQCARELGLSIEPAGTRITQARPLTSLPPDAVLWGQLTEENTVYHHWTVWDAEQQIIRDPYDNKLPFRPTSYRLVLDRR